MTLRGLVEIKDKQRVWDEFVHCEKCVNIV